jgi:hypothetical protein
VYPGASYVETEGVTRDTPAQTPRPSGARLLTQFCLILHQGHKTDLSKMKREQRVALAKVCLACPCAVNRTELRYM